MPKIRPPKKPPIDIIEMALTGPACAWTDDEMAAYKRHTERWPNQQFGLKEWLRWEREHAEYVRSLASQEQSERRKETS